MIVIGIAACIFLAASFAVMAFVIEAHSRKMSDRFTVVAASVMEDETPEILKRSLRERIFQPMLDRLNEFASRLTPTSSVRAANLRIERAGKPWGLTASTWSLLRTGCIILGGVGAFLAHTRLPLSGLASICVTGAIAGAGLFLPSFMLDNKIKQRQMAVRRALPDVIDLLVVSVEAGLGLDAAVHEVINRRSGPLLDEFQRVLAEIQVGQARRVAWQQLAQRVDVLELKVFVAALVQAEELGASVAGVLRNQSEALRVRRSLSVREVAAMLPVKMLFPLIFFIFPGVFVVILGPGVITMMDSFREIGF